MIRASTSCRNTSSPPAACVEPEHVVGAAQRVPQMPHPRGAISNGPGPSHRRRGVQTQIELALPAGQPLPRRGLERLQLLLVVRRAEVLDAAAPRAATSARSAPPSPPRRSSPCARTPPTRPYEPGLVRKSSHHRQQTRSSTPRNTTQDPLLIRVRFVTASDPGFRNQPRPRNRSANAVAKRFVGTIRRELLDRLLIINQRHAAVVLHELERHYNGHRPHHTLRQAAPSTTTPPSRNNRDPQDRTTRPPRRARPRVSAGRMTFAAFRARHTRRLCYTEVDDYSKSVTTAVNGIAAKPTK